MADGARDNGDAITSDTMMTKRYHLVMSNSYPTLTVQELFRGLKEQRPPIPAEGVALSYAKWMWKTNITDTGLALPAKPARLNIALAASAEDVERLTRRGILTAESLLLATGNDGAPRHFEDTYNMAHAGETAGANYVMCSDLERMGNWLIDCEQLIVGGLALWLPKYEVRGPTYASSRRSALVELLSDQIARHRIATWLGESDPLLNRLIHPVLRIELPYIDGTSLRAISQIIVEEMDSYTAFRDFLRRRFLDLDVACDSEQMDRELVKIGLEIAEGIRSLNSELTRVKSRRAVAVTGAAIGSVAASLVAVYGPALSHAIAVLGAGGGLWSIINAVAESRNYRSTQESSPWYFLWTLDKNSR